MRCRPGLNDRSLVDNAALTPRDLSDMRNSGVTADANAAELVEWACGYGLDQRQSGDKARRLLGWQPRHLDPET